MPRARQTRGGKTSGAAAGSSSNGAGKAEKLTCPECGKEFTRPAALGAHRSRAHGISGQSSAAKRARAARGSGSGAKRGGRGRAAASSGSGRAGAGRQSRPRANSSGATVDRDALLAMIFPGGVPPKESVIRSVSSWLDDAERLARMR